MLARGMGKSGCAIKFCKIISDRGLQFVSKRFLHWWLTLRLALQRRRWRVTSANGAGGSAQNPAARSAGGTQKAALALAGRFHSADFCRLRASVAAGGEVWRRCGGGVAEVWRRCGGGVSEVCRRCVGGVAEVWRRCGGGVRPDGNLLAPPNDCSCACRE